LLESLKTEPNDTDLNSTNDSSN